MVLGAPCKEQWQDPLCFEVIYFPVYLHMIGALKRRVLYNWKQNLFIV